jgi:transcriptional regulator with PAS, ATPase and Fis domain
VLLGYVRTEGDRDINAYCTVKPILDEEGEVRYVTVTMYDPDRLRGRYAEFASMNDATQAPIRVRQDPMLGVSEPVVGSSQALWEVYAIAKRVAHTDATVLICGESGVGKEGVADFICTNSPRRNKPFVKVNCTAIPANLLESELFGYEGGSFTGANAKGKAGLFEQANGGTILLDEIGDLSIDLQTKLLRVIQQRELMRVGGTSPMKLDVRIIASTNADLKKKMTEGTFREDLYYRLSTIPIYVPALRERREDIPELITYYLDYYGQHHHRFIQVSDEHMAVFQRYSWPGNIRQLRNVVEYLVVCADDDYLSNINPLLRILDIDGNTGEMRSVLPTLAESMQSYEKMVISQAIRKTGGIRKAAEALGIDPATVSRKVKKYHIEVPGRDKEPEGAEE